jgi:hypothetical protein
MHSFKVSLEYESVDRTTFSTWSAVHWKCTSVNAFIPQWNFKRMHSILIDIFSPKRDVGNLNNIYDS